ncbi:hypothetical protein CJU89_4858 [Yarrowia sp. B02]|nr:hypothetical protein CJU89_4858 [Yarrowia sp. B02]
MNAFPEPSSLEIEFAKQMNRPRTVQFKQLAAVLYIFGGTSALIYIVSKTILNPLFEELTFARSEYATHARRLMEQLNAKLSSMVSYIPPVRALQGQRFVDAQTQTEEEDEDKSEVLLGKSSLVAFGESPMQLKLAEKEKQQRLIDDSVDNLERLTDSLKFAGEVSDLSALSGFKYQVEELTNYSDQLAMTGYSMMKSGLPGHETAMSETKKEIRSLKGSVLKRLTLNRLQVSDFEESVALWNDEETVKFCGGARPRSTVWMKVLYHCGHWDNFGYGCYAVRLKETGEYVGEIGINHFMRDSEPIYSPQMPEAGWVVNPKFHGQGFASEALSAIFREADASDKVTHSICCIIDQGENEPSRKVARKFGFKQQEGTIKLGDEKVDLFIREK